VRDAHLSFEVVGGHNAQRLHAPLVAEAFGQS